MAVIRRDASSHGDARISFVRIDDDDDDDDDDDARDPRLGRVTTRVTRDGGARGVGRVVGARAGE